MIEAQKKTVLIIGGGAVGAIAALNLEVGGLAEVTLVLRSNYDAVNTHGFDIKSCDHGQVQGWKASRVRNTIPNLTTESLPPYGYILLCTKNIPDIPPTPASLVAPALPPSNTHTVLILLQNGLHIHKPFLASHPTTPVLSGISMIGSEETAPGKIIQDDPDRLLIGAFPNPNLGEDAGSAAAQDFARRYSAGGKTSCRVSGDVLHDRWRKLVYNAVLNPVCAILGLDTGRLRLAGGGEVVEGVVRPAMREVVRAAGACGVQLEEGVVEEMVEAEPVESYLSPSMLADVRKGNFIEYENLLGEPLREGKEKGVEMPTIEMLYYMAKAVQWRTAERKGLVEIPAKKV
ncbi:2-dehydropantoate 2-reductase [Bimuria novae-zelandiae CBS 107.79]|uniref:2-dehydropantoate 2-reductase n=1 Tax=Bimuria novae-zelandiae CBS 107.79 TaxID=1447943 RepID=A0A6A5VSH3_9PLEO|nr:2-dehydropantoate 2-reductase [Bimuria novae-zelandiae CBS 107.79]